METLATKVVRARNLMNWSQAQLATFAGVSPSAVYRLEAGDLVTPRGLAQKLMLNAAERVFEAQRSGMLDTIPDLTSFMPARPRVTARSSDTQTNTEQGMRIVHVSRTVPTVTSLGIAASGWVDLETQDVGYLPVKRGDASVIVQVRGDSMSPRYRDGQHVLFVMLDPEEATPVAGVDYVFIRSDNHGTFKRVARVDRDGYELRALNPKYEKPLHVSKDEVVMVGEARFIVSDIPD